MGVESFNESFVSGGVRRAICDLCQNAREEHRVSLFVEVDRVGLVRPEILCLFEIVIDGPLILPVRQVVLTSLNIFQPRSRF